MSLLSIARQKKPAYERLRRKGLLSLDEIEILEELRVLKPKNELGGVKNDGKGKSKTNTTSPSFFKE